MPPAVRQISPGRHVAVVKEAAADGVVIEPLVVVDRQPGVVPVSLQVIEVLLLEPTTGGK